MGREAEGPRRKRAEEVIGGRPKRGAAISLRTPRTPRCPPHSTIDGLTSGLFWVAGVAFWPDRRSEILAGDEQDLADNLEGESGELGRKTA